MAGAPYVAWYKSYADGSDGPDSADDGEGGAGDPGKRYYNHVNSAGAASTYDVKRTVGVGAHNLSRPYRGLTTVYKYGNAIKEKCFGIICYEICT